ncbi:MAG: hypothetical protein KGJ58_01880 [Patescibacteria group bacterium]|nr:hypothetical protein [Patescibacteria group bacterium]MDE1988775.1 hypothetical protein [Patescibacteria group bacterium]MDE2218188.1 hypothetical protein [Patescibacteria group bacterium]
MIMATISLIEENIPCWYELSYNNMGLDDNGILKLRIHEEFIAKKGNIPPNDPIVTDFIETFKFKTFEGDFSKQDLGFSKLLKNTRQFGFYELEAKLPLVVVEEEKDCPYCDGTGQDKNLERKCLFCWGSGKPHVYQWQDVIAISASLSVLFRFIFWAENFMSSLVKKQLLTVQTVTRFDSQGHGGSMSGVFSPVFASFLRTDLFRKPAEVRAKATMINAWSKMNNPNKFFDDFDFRVNLQGGRLIMDCPGDACGIHPEVWDELAPDRGYKFSCHNVDNAIQQLTLLAGLAALHDMARTKGI